MGRLDELELISDLPRHRFCRAERGGERGPLREVVHSSKFSLGLLRYEPEMEVGRVLHHRQEVNALDFCGNLDRRNEPMENRTELGTLGWRHLTEIQQMAPSLDDDGSCAGLLKRGVLGEEVLTFNDVATWARGRPGALTPFSGRPDAGRCGSPTGGNTEGDRSRQSFRLLRAPREMWTSIFVLSSGG
jgi:hypothetical protein